MISRSKQSMTKGSVIKIRLQNFMTYLDETLWPGPSFNCCVGANGSGKSSIVTALCICLGGDIKNLNRQTDLKSLVNNNSNQSEAIIEVELYIPKDRNTLVQCIIYSNGKGLIHKVNGKKVSSEELRVLMDDLQIQPGNDLLNKFDENNFVAGQVTCVSSCLRML